MRDQVYPAANENSIAGCSRGAGSDAWDEGPWRDEIRDRPSEQDVAEAVALLNPDPVEAFESWVTDLDDTSFCKVTRALRTLREAVIRYHAEKADREPIVAVRDVLEAF